MKLDFVYGIKPKKELLENLKLFFKDNKDILYLLNDMNYIGYSIVENNLYLKDIYFDENNIFCLSNYLEKFKVKVSKKEKDNYNNLIIFLKDIFKETDTRFLDEKPCIMFILKD